MNSARHVSVSIQSSCRNNSQRFLSELKEFIRIPSVSSQPKHAPDVKRCAGWLANHLRQIGLENARVIKTPRHPIVYADWLHAPGRPTVLIYGHYDVQPVEPVSEWQTPPFEPVVRGDNLYGRGASDDKGQLFTHVKALECYLRVNRRLPVNVKCLFEGEEEIGSPSLQSFLTRHRRALAADVAVMSDTRMLAPNRPAITYALRGALSLELEVSGPPQDLHSGNYGGAVHNPVQVLCELTASLHDSSGRIRVPGFYDRVRNWSDRERDYMARHGPSDATILRDAGLKKGWGERGYSLYEQTTIRPTLTITGISGGHQGPGGKSIIPARANAKISIRLVPDQVPDEIEHLFRQHIARVTPATVCSSVRTHFVTSPALVSRRHPAMKAAIDACRKGFGTAPVFLRSGGSIPVVNSFQTLLGIPTILMGFGLPDDRIHAPNEKFHLPNLYKGIDTCIWFLSKMGRTDGIETPCVNYSLCLPRQNFYDDLSSWMIDDLNPG
jgi:acetylornithine deacetylase/succinyl-diaminopimelate desuccinylase-like protein